MAKKQPPEINEIPVVVLTADTLIQLVRQVDAMEEKIKALEDQLQSNFDYLVGCIPSIVEGNVRLKAIPEDGDNMVEVVVQRKDM